jgi:outer membrane protein assembly factor BamB
VCWRAEAGIGNGTIVTTTDANVLGPDGAFSPGGAGFVQGGMEVADPDKAPVGDRRGQTPRELRGKRAKYREVLSGVDLATGKVVWRYELHAHYVPQHRSPHVTPSVDGRRVYAYGTLGVLACVDAASGQELWRRDLPEELGTEIKKYGTTGSPKVYRDLVYVIAYGGRKGVWIHAFDKATGKHAWGREFAIGGQNPHSSPVVATVDGRTALLGHLGQAVVALDPASGRELWRLDYTEAIEEVRGGKCFSSESYPLVMKGGLIVDRVWNDIGSLGENRAAGSRGRTLAFRVQEGQPAIAWDNPEVSAYYLGMQPWDGYVYFFDDKHVSGGYQWDRGNLTCVEVSTGRTMWQTKDWALPARAEARSYRRGPCPSLAIAGGMIIINDGIHLVLGRCSPKGFERVDAFVVDLNPWASPVVSHGKLYVRAGSELICYDLRPAGAGEGADRPGPGRSGASESSDGSQD